MSLRELFRRGEDPKRVENLLRILEVNKALAAQPRVDALLELIVDAAIDLTGAERGFVVLADDTDIAIECARNADREPLRKPRSKISTSIVRHVLSSGEGLRVEDASEAFEAAGSVMDLKLRSVLAVPLKTSSSWTGCLYVDNRFARGSFSAEAQSILEAFADQASVALDQGRLREQARVLEARLRAHNDELQVALHTREEELDRMRRQWAEPPPREALRHAYEPIVGESAAIRRVLHLLDRVIDGAFPVLITGESGTGKELVARCLHDYGPRAAGPFLALNCAALPTELVESELFGHARGAFTGADVERPGSFAAADGGVLFLDEIGELPLATQAKLLRVLQEGCVRPVGTTVDRAVDVRVLAATNRRLLDEVEAGRFRADLYYRISVVEVALPALRERLDDVPALVRHLLARAGSQAVLPEDTLARLTGHSWPGNVRELQNELTRVIAMRPEGALRPEDFRLEGRASSGPEEADRFRGLTLEEVEERVIRQTLERVGGNKAEAARALGLPRRTLYNRLRKYGLMD